MEYGTNQCLFLQQFISNKKCNCTGEVIMLQIVICEDNKEFLDQFTNMIQSILDNNKIKGEILCTTTNVRDVEFVIASGKGNTFFLDIDLKDSESGYTLAEKIRKNNPYAYIVFVTGHFEYVLHAFKVYAFDFLQKPVTYEILEQCLQRIHDHHMVISNDYKYIEVKSGSNLYKIKTNDIVYIERFKRDTIIYTKNGQVTCHKSLDSLLKQLNDTNFVRCHKSFIANKQLITQINQKERIIVFKTDQKCSFGRKYKNEISDIFCDIS